MKAGHQTTEFYLSVLTIVAAVALCIAGKVDGNAAMTAIGAVSLGYSTSRGIAKAVPPKDSQDGPLD